MADRGTLENPIPVRGIFKAKDGTIYELANGNAGNGTGSGTGGTTVDVSTATDAVKGIVYLSDNSGDADAQTGATAVTPKALKAFIETSIPDVIDQIIQDKINNGELGSGGGSSPSDKTLQPSITIEGDLNNVPLTGLTLNASAFASTNNDVHDATHWMVSDGMARSVVWEQVVGGASTSITVSETLNPATTYEAKVRYRGLANNWSAWGSKSFTTGYVNQPSITVTGGGSNVAVRPSFTGSAFNPSAADTLIKSVWSVETTDGTVIWSKEVPNAVTVTVDVDLANSTSYLVKVRYVGTKFGESSFGQASFTTVAAPAIVTPTVSIEGGTTDVGSLPVLTASAFEVTNGTDTHEMTEWHITTDAGEEYWTKQSSTDLTSVSVDKALINASSYKASVRFKGTALGWSAWSGVVSFTTASSFASPENDFGTVASGTFGVGTAPKPVYESLGLSELPNTHVPDDFQYGLYSIENTQFTIPCSDDFFAYVKYIPKFYYTFLNDATGRHLSDAALANVSKYTRTSVALLKQAMARSPNNAIAIAPASAFVNEENANAHNFILHRAFIDGGKEMPGFFIANTLAMHATFFCNDPTARGALVTVHAYRFGAPEFGSNKFMLSSNGQYENYFKSLDLCRCTSTYGNLTFDSMGICKMIPAFTMTSIYMWAALAMLSFAAGLYCKDASECAWYKPEGDSSPRGINTTGDTDSEDPLVMAAVPITETTGSPWVSDIKQYPKTTHNGKMNGVTNVNGWLAQPVLGVTGDYLKWMPNIWELKKITIKDIEKEYTENINVGFSDWGVKDRAMFSYGVKDVSRAICGAIPTSAAFPTFVQEEKNIFGHDKFIKHEGYQCPVVGGEYNRGQEYSGIFWRGSHQYWSSQNYTCGVRLGGYPKL